VVAAAVGGALWLSRPDGGVAPTVTATGRPTRTPAPAEPAATAPPTCASVSRSFAPRSITVVGVTRGAGVVTPAREPDGVPGAPPLTTHGKTVFAFDRAQGVRPGDPRGNVLLNAHTWPDGTALGNHLLAKLHRGGRIVVRGDDLRLCYRVTERVQVLASRGLPRYYSRKGPPQLAIVVCSGRRLGPGIWEKRTVWFATPSA